MKKEIKEIKDQYHAISSKKFGNKKIRRTFFDDIDRVTENAIKLHAFHIINNRSRKEELVHEDNDKMHFLEIFININNRFKRNNTESCIKNLTKYDKEGSYLAEFFKILLSSPNRLNKEQNEYLYNTYINHFDYIFSPEDIQVLSKRKNQEKFYHLLVNGGCYYKKQNKLLSFYSLFYKQSKLEKDEYYDLVEEGIGSYTEYTYEFLSLSETCIRNLIKYNIINENHLKDIYYDEDRDFYIPKKKRKKRVYTEDKIIGTIYFNDLKTKDTLYSSSEYNTGTRKLRRDKTSYKKRYIPVEKGDMKISYFINTLKNKELLFEMIDEIKNKSNRE